MRRRVCAVVAVLVLASLAPTAVGGVSRAFSQQSVDADVVVMTAAVGADGDADWTIDYRLRLTDENETRAFESLQADIRENESAYTSRFHDRLNRTARAGANATGRSMAVENVTVDAARENLGQSYGVVTYRFRWTNFATATDSQVAAGDALAGLYLDRQTSLTLQWPGGYRAATVRPAADEETSRSVTWRGPQSFGADEPRVVLDAPALSFRDVAPESPSGWVGFTLAVVALGALGYGAYRYVLADDRSGAASAEPSAAEPTAADDATETPPDLLSNEEQVMGLLRESGGRIKQQRVASELDWTDAKTSQVIGGLREDGDLETFRIGRENVVTLPDTDLTGEEHGGEDDSESDR